MTSIDETMISFLKLVREDSLVRKGRGLGSHSRSQLTSLFHKNLRNNGEFPEVLDLLFYNKLIDAESKQYNQFEGYFVTELGVEFLRHRERFLLENGELARKPVRSVDPASWTGSKLVLADEKIIAEIRQVSVELREKIYATSFRSNSDSQDIKSLADALVSVCEMAEPDVGLIERILAHPKFKMYTAFAVGIATIRGALGI